MRRVLATSAVAMLLTLVVAGPAAACGGLIGRNGAVNLVRTTTLAAHHDGVEHYVTSFAFSGGKGEFGSIVPLPGVPTKVERGGQWTLQRLVRETRPQPEAVALADTAGRASSTKAKVLLETRIDALDITVLEGGGTSVAEWAEEHGFLLPSDARDVLGHYAARSPVFMAARFDADEARARGQQVGDGTPIHLTIPTAHPWVPLRILSLGKPQAERVQADVYLLTDRRPALLSSPRRGEVSVTADGPASDRLLADLRADKGMDWVPDRMWLTALEVDVPAGDLRYDLATDVNGGSPSPVAAGRRPPAGSSPSPTATDPSIHLGPGVFVVGAALVTLATGAAAALGAGRLRRGDAGS